MAMPLPTRRNHNFQDLTGRQFGKLTVVGYAGRNKNGNSKWDCRCECGGTSTPTTRNLTSGKAQSCGCLGRIALERGHPSHQKIDPIGKIILKGGHVCLIDPEDLPLVSGSFWHAQKSSHGGTYYAKRSWPSPYLMHVLLMGRKGIDHKNGNGLDNRRSNLRFATGSQNQANRNKLSISQNRFKGVVAPRPRQWSKRWAARIRIGGKFAYLGRFDTEEQAARAYDAKAKEVHGEFARLNFPEEP